jgi:hypothetical protein
MTVQQALNSPIFLAILSIIVALYGAHFRMTQKIASKLSSLDSTVSSLATAITDIKGDRNIVLWSDLQRADPREMSHHE